MNRYKQQIETKNEFPAYAECKSLSASLVQTKLHNILVYADVVFIFFTLQGNCVTFV